MSCNRGMSLFHKISAQSTAPLQALSKGRSTVRIEGRDSFILHRFYFKSKLQKLPYKVVIEELEKELWLSSRTIQDIIQKKTELLLEIKKMQPTLKYFKKEWNQWVWG